MKKFTSTLTALALSLSVANAQADAATDAKFGASILGSALAGAVIAGPIGFIGGTFAGIYIGEQIESADSAEQLGLELAVTSQALEAREQQLVETQEALNIQTDQYQRSMESLERALSLDLRFALDSSSISERDADRLDYIAELLVTYPQLRLDIDGYADQIGDEAYNLDLSKARAESVKAALIERGVEEFQLSTMAHGEIKTSSAPSPAEYAQHRRVSLTVTSVDADIAQH